MKRFLPVLVLLPTALLAGCGGGGNGSSGAAVIAPSIQSTASASASASENAIGATNAMGTPMTQLAANNGATSSLQFAERSAQSIALGVCRSNAAGGSYEFFAPDKGGDANSTEQQYFYDGSCSQLARDVVRVWTTTGPSSESVNRTMKIFTSGSTTASATRTDTDLFRNASFDQFGFPIPANGFARSATGSLQIAGVSTTASGDEFVMSAANAGSESYCSDAAGYSVAGNANLNETFGWQGGVSSGGTRTVNADGSVTWTATHAGSSVKGPIGSLSLATGSANTACPIATPMFTLNGGTSTGAYSIPTSATFKSGLLIGLTVTNAVLANGNTLNVTTNAGVSPTSPSFISGTVATAGTQIASFTVNAFGDGTLTVISSGTQYTITDWHVVR